MERERCPYCHCILALDVDGEPIPHDHTDDSSQSLEDRPRSDY